MWSTALAQELCLSAYPFLQQLVTIRIEIFADFPTATAKESNAMMFGTCRDTPCLLYPLHLLCLLISSELAVVYKSHLRFSSPKYIAVSNSPNIWMLERKGGCYSITSVSMFPLPFLPSLRQVFEITRVLAVSHDNPQELLLTPKSVDQKAQPAHAFAKSGSPTTLHYQHVTDQQWPTLWAPGCLHEVTKSWKG